MTKNYCGCCGTEISNYDIWCKRCKSHVIPSSEYYNVWDRTFLAQFGKPCPYQINSLSLIKIEVKHD